MVKRLEQVASWFQKHASRLRSMAPEDAADELHGQLSKLEGDLTVEVADDEQARELIVSASGNVELFGTVERICAALGAPGWQIVALKPPLGFEFTLDTEDGTSLDVSLLQFDPLESDAAPGEVGIKVLAPRHLVAMLRPAVGLVVETGIGERLAAAINHLEVGEIPERSEALPIHDLESYVLWHLKRRGGRQS